MKTAFDIYQELQQLEMDCMRYQETIDELEQEEGEEVKLIIEEIQESMEQMDLRTAKLLKYLQTVPVDISEENLERVIRSKSEDEWREIELIL